MANTLILLAWTLSLTAVTFAAVPADAQESAKGFVYVHTQKNYGRPIARKEKATEEDRPFETAHKLPLSLTFKLNEDVSSDDDHKINKRGAQPGTPAPAPAGSIKLDPLKLLQKYKEDLKVSSTTTPKVAPKAAKSRSKKEAAYISVATSPRPSLTSGAPPTPRTLDINDAPLLASGSDKQRSKIQIKKGPNGQEYEYEYVYYYYDEESDKSTTEKVHNSHDGPERNLSKEKTYKEASSNEIIPNSRGRTRGRQIELEESVGEDRLPPSTRFPPRGRNIASTEVLEDEISVSTARSRERSRTTASNSKADSVSEESQSTRGRTNVRGPSLDLVDNASFNTHSGSSNAGPSFPSDLPSGPVRFLGATPNERIEQDVQENLTKEMEQSSSDSVVPDTSITPDIDATTITISPMDKVALDLYAVVQGTQKLSGETDENEAVGVTSEEIDTTTLQMETTEYIPPTTTTTTTTTTTPAPTTTTTTTTTTEAPSTGRGRFRGTGNRKKQGTTATTPASSETSQSDGKPKNRFNRPSFGRPKSGRTTAEPAHEPESNAEEHKSSSKSRPTPRTRFGGSRNKVTTETLPSSEEEHVAVAKPSLTRSRPSFNVRGRGRSSTSAPASESSGEDGHSESSSSTTARPKLKISGNNNVRPLRPGLRINSLSKGRASPSPTTTPAGETQQPETTQEESKSSEESSEEPAPAPVEDKNPLNRLRNRHRPAPTASSASKPKAAASSTVQVRRANPLISRRRLGSTEPSSTEAAVEPEPTEPLSGESNESTEAAAEPSSSTTEEPKGLNKLLAGRRKLTRQHVPS